MKGAVNMLEVMRNSHLEPSSETYAALACGYAENGDIEGLSNVLHEANVKELHFSVKSYMKMILSLADSGNSEHMDKIFSEFDVQWHRSEAMNAAFSLIDKGHNDAAYKIIQLIAATGFRRVFYHFMRTLALKGQPFDKVLTYCQDIYEKGICESIYEDAVRSNLLFGRIDVALELLKEIKKLGRPVRCHYFWPILAIHSKDGNLEGIWSTLKFMSDMGLLAESDTYVDFIFPHVPTSDLFAVIPKIKELGQSDAVATDALFLYLCINGQMNAAADFYKGYKPHCNFPSIINTLASGKHDDVGSVVKLLKLLREEIPDQEARDDFFGAFINRLLFHQQNDIPLLQRFLQEFNAQDIKLPSLFIETTCMRLKGFAPELVRLARNLEIDVISDLHKDANFISPRDMSVKQLENRLAITKETGENARPVLRHLLSHYCREKNLDRVVEIKAEMDAVNFTYSPACYALLVNLYVAHNKLEEAMMYKKEIDVQYPHFKLDAAKGLEYVALMINCGRIDEAVEVVKSEAKHWLPPRYTDLLMTGIKKVLHAAANAGCVKVTQNLFHILVMDSNSVPMHPTVLEPLIKVHMVRNEPDAAIEEYKKYVEHHNVYPSRNFLFKKFIASKDHERLQKVVDISTIHGGKDRALHELAAAFIESGCVQEARKVIQTLGTKADIRHLGAICHRFFKQEKVLELEQLIGITKDLYHLDRDQLYMHLLNLYVQTNDYQSALEMWNGMQEENVQPSAVTLRKLADLLEKNDQPIPFVVPETGRPVSEKFSELLKCLNERNEVELVDVLKRMNKGEIHDLSANDFSSIVDVLVEKKALKEIVDIVQVMSCILSKPAEILRPVATKYGELGDVDAMKMLYDCLPDFAHRYMNFNENYFEAYLRSGQDYMLVSELEENINSSKKLFSVKGFMKLMDDSEMLDRIVELTDAYAEKENFELPKAALWAHYFLTNEYAEAAKVYKKYSSVIMRTEYLFTRIMRFARFARDELMAKHLVKVANETLKPNIMSRAYSCLLDILVYHGKLGNAVALIEEAKNKGIPTEEFLHPTLVSLKKSLTEKNMPVPFVIASKGDESSSSSDDSD